MPAYWSGAYVINAYGHKHEDLRTIKDFDLMIVRKDNLSLAESRNDLELLPDALASDKIAVFRLKAPAAEERK